MDNDKPQSVDLAQSIMAKIEGGELTPRPKLWFVIHDAFFWACWLASAVLGGAALAATLFAAKIVEPRYFLWLVSFLIMCLLAVGNLRQTPHAYRYPTTWLIIGNLIVTVLLGLTFYAVGFGRLVDHDIGSRLPLDKPFHTVCPEGAVRNINGRRIIICKDVRPYQRHKKAF